MSVTWTLNMNSLLYLYLHQTFHKETMTTGLNLIRVPSFKLYDAMFPCLCFFDLRKRGKFQNTCK